MNFLMIFQAILGIIRSIEVLMPESEGADKYSAAMESVREVVADESLAQSLGQVVNAGVSLLNAVGEFRHK